MTRGATRDGATGAGETRPRHRPRRWQRRAPAPRDRALAGRAPPEAVLHVRRHALDAAAHARSGENGRAAPKHRDRDRAGARALPGERGAGAVPGHPDPPAVEPRDRRRCLSAARLRARARSRCDGHGFPLRPFHLPRGPLPPVRDGQLSAVPPPRGLATPARRAGDLGRDRLRMDRGRCADARLADRSAPTDRAVDREAFR